MTASGFADINMEAAGPTAKGVYTSKIPHSHGIAITSYSTIVLHTE